MRIPDEILKSVCFLCVPKGKSTDALSFQYGGTAFFVSVPYGSDKRAHHVYLVTAKHNVEKASNLGYQLHARLNTKEGGIGFVPLPAEWFYPENPAEDVAVLPFPTPWDVDKPADIDIKAFNPDIFALNPAIENQAIGIGDEIMVIGLFSQRYGTTRNHPIVRSGIISAMPGEPLIDDSGYDYDIYLAEVRSIGGLSGSPVLVILDPMRPGAMGVRKTPPTLHSIFYLLGLVRGHWDLKKQLPTVDYADDELQQVNMGIAQITPIHDVVRVLMSDEVKKHRRKVEETLRKVKSDIASK